MTDSQSAKIAASPHRINLTVNAPDGSIRELPFVIGVLADLSGMLSKPLPKVSAREFLDVDVRNIDDVLKACAPRLTFKVDNKLTEDPDGLLCVELRFECLDDFSPERVARSIAPLRKLLDTRNALAYLEHEMQSNDKLEELVSSVLTDSDKLAKLEQEIQPQPEAEPAPRPHLSPPAEPGVWSTRPSILDHLVDVSRPATPEKRDSAKEWIKTLVQEVAHGEMTPRRDMKVVVNQRIADVDELVGRQLDEVLQHPAFMALEATWRGLYYLVQRTRKAAGVKVRVLNVSRKELLRDFENADEIHRSSLARLIQMEELETAGGEPYGLLIGDYLFGRHPEDTQLLSELGRLGGSAHVPFVAAASPGLLGLESFTSLPNVPNVDEVFNSTAYFKWRDFRGRVYSRNVGLVLPGVLMRLPYGKNTVRVEAFAYEERQDGHHSLLWANAVWPFAATFARTFHTYGWFGGIRDPGDRGLISGLVLYRFDPDTGVSPSGPTEVAISDRHYDELRASGLIPLCQIKRTSDAMFFEAWSCHKPLYHPDEDPPTTYESAELSCVLGVSRIAHCVKWIVRHERQVFRSIADCEDHLRKWIAPYLVPRYAKGSSAAAGFPLIDARFQVVATSDGRDNYLVKAFVLPQLGSGCLEAPVEVSIPVVLPLHLSAEIPDESAAVAISRSEANSVQIVQIDYAVGASRSVVGASNGHTSGRGRFIERLFMAESCLRSRRLEVATLILEELAEQVDHFHLDAWESPELVSRVWELLRGCYQTAPVRPDAEERCASLLSKICRLDPARAIE